MCKNKMISNNMTYLHEQHVTYLHEQQVFLLAMTSMSFGEITGKYFNKLKIVTIHFNALYKPL